MINALVFMSILIAIGPGPVLLAIVYAMHEDSHNESIVSNVKAITEDETDLSYMIFNKKNNDYNENNSNN